jgi:hypothetical protein
MGFSPSALQKDQETGGRIKSFQIGISVGARHAVPAQDNQSIGHHFSAVGASPHQTE